VSVFDVSTHFYFAVLHYAGPVVNGSVQQRRDRILRATADLIRRDGIAAITTKRIAAEADCAEGTIFRHFGDKGGLIAAVLSFGLPEIYRLDELTSRPADADPRSALIAIGRAVMDYYTASYPIVSAALSDASIFARYVAAHEAAGTGPRQIWMFVHRYLLSAQSAGSVRADADLETEAMVFAGACQNAAWVAMVNGASALPHGGENYVERLVDTRLELLTNS
jgi:AcrR family transcriptional regulator